LCAQDKKSFWKIFQSFDFDDSFRDLFEKMIEKDP
jgi:hypothetical protein